MSNTPEDTNALERANRIASFWKQFEEFERSLRVAFPCFPFKDNTAKTPRLRFWWDGLRIAVVTCELPVPDIEELEAAFKSLVALTLKASAQIQAAAGAAALSANAVAAAAAAAVAAASPPAPTPPGLKSVD